MLRISSCQPLRTKVIQSRVHRPIFHRSSHRISKWIVRSEASPLQLPLEKVDASTQLEAFPDEPGVYAVYDKEDVLQFVGISRKIRTSLRGHARDLPDLTCSVRYEVKPEASKEDLQNTWKQWIEQHVEETGQIPKGNLQGETLWKPKRSPASKSEIRLTPGKGIDDLTVPIIDLIAQVIISCKVVVFIKGTRTEPQCGFSQQMLTILNQNRVDYEVVNVLDEIHNPGVRESIKEFSQWPTIPQLYVNGQFVGGTDIVMEMQEKGELQKLLQSV